MCDSDSMDDMIEYQLKSTQLSRRRFGALTLGTGMVSLLPRAAGAAWVEESEVDIKTPAGTCDAYFVHPSEGAHPGVLMWPDIFGLRPAFRHMARRLAEAGYAVMVPNPFYRTKHAPTAPENPDFNDKPTRDMSAFEGARLLAGAPGSKVKLLVFRGNAAEPHDLVITRERIAGPDLTSKMANATTGYVRVVDFTKETPARVKQAFETLGKSGAQRFVIDLRGTARGDIDDGIATARLFVPSGTLTVRQSKDQREVVAAASADGVLKEPVALLVSQGTSGAAEVFAAALDGNDRAELIGEHTLGRAARQRLVKLPDGSGLLLSNVRYLTPKNSAIHERGLAPEVEVDEPDVDFGAEPPAGDSMLDKAIDVLVNGKPAAPQKKAA